MINKLSVLFLLQTKTKIAKMIPEMKMIFKNLTIQMMMSLLVDIVFT